MMVVAVCISTCNVYVCVYVCACNVYRLGDKSTDTTKGSLRVRACLYFYLFTVLYMDVLLFLLEVLAFCENPVFNAYVVRLCCHSLQKCLIVWSLTSTVVEIYIYISNIILICCYELCNVYQIECVAVCLQVWYIKHVPLPPTSTCTWITPCL